MTKILPCFAAIVCLLILGTTPEAQGQSAAAAPRASTSPAAFGSTYAGAVVWQQPDGTTIRGTISLNLSPLPASSKLRLLAQLDFGPADGAPARSVLFRGKIESNGVGSMRLNAQSVEDTGQTAPVLDPGRVAVFISAHGYATGGALAKDGTQLTFRANLTTTPQTGAAGD